MISPDLTHSVKVSLKTMMGQLGYVAEKLDQEHDPTNLLLQLKAVQATLSKVIVELLDETYRKALAEKISFSWQHCTGTCGYETVIERLRRLFPDIPPEKVPEELKKAITIEQHLRKILAEKNLDTPHSIG